MLEHETLPNGSVRFSVSSAGQPVAKGVLHTGHRGGAADGQRAR